MRVRIKPKKVLLFFLLGFVFIYWLTPVFYMAVNSFKPLREVIMETAAMPTSFYVDNFVNVWKNTRYLILLQNSTFVTGLSIVGVVLLSAMTGYKLGRSKGRWANLLILYFILVLVFPFQSIMIPLVKVMRDLSLIDSRLGLVFIYLALQSPMAIFLYSSYVKGIPRSLEESAYMDGAGEVRTFFSIIFPLMRPITGTVIILNALWIWNDFLLPLIMIQTPEKKTIPLGTTAVFFGRYMSKWHWGITSIFLASLPMILLYLFLQRYIIKGIMEGAVKG